MLFWTFKKNVCVCVRGGGRGECLGKLLGSLLRSTMVDILGNEMSNTSTTTKSTPLTTSKHPTSTINKTPSKSPKSSHKSPGNRCSCKVCEELGPKPFPVPKGKCYIPIWAIVDVMETKKIKKVSRKLY